MLDFHNHLIPGVDVGAPTLDVSQAGIQEMRQQGVDQIITTPHFRASMLTEPAALAAYIEQVDTAWESLRSAAARKWPDLTLARGFEILLDSPEPQFADPKMCLGNSRS